jgi:peptidoglycan/LPS O-acetylase OafA/YrhL
MKETKCFLQIVSEYRSALMGIAMLSIMLSHQRFVHFFPFNVFEAYGHWGVDIFLFLSGMGMVRSLENHSIGLFYRRRFLRLVPICIFCGVFKYLAYLFVGEPIENLKVGLNIGIWSLCSLDLWFIHSIIIYYLLTPFFYRLLKCCLLQTLVMVYLLSIIFQLFYAEQVGFDWLNPLGVSLYTIERLPVFMIGMIVSMYNNGITQKHFVISGISLFMAICLAVLLKTDIIPLTFCACVYPLLSLGIFALVLSMIYSFTLIPKNVLRGFEFMGNHSLEIYLVHEFIFGAFLLTMYTKYNHFLLLIIVLGLSVVIAWCCRWCVDRIMAYTH